GGFQMLGLSTEDPAGVESAGESRETPGLGMLPVRTVMREVKTVRRATGQTLYWNAPTFRGYEIHMGETTYEAGAERFAQIVREGEDAPVADGAVHCGGRVWGTYVHGLFDDDAFRHAFLAAARKARGLEPTERYVCVTAEREARIDRWADHLR